MDFTNNIESWFLKITYLDKKTPILLYWSRGSQSTHQKNPTCGTHQGWAKSCWNGSSDCFFISIVTSKLTEFFVTKRPCLNLRTNFMQFSSSFRTVGYKASNNSLLCLFTPISFTRTIFFLWLLRSRNFRRELWCLQFSKISLDR